MEWQIPSDRGVAGDGAGDTPAQHSGLNFAQLSEEFGLPRWLGPLFEQRSEQLRIRDREDLKRFLQPSLRDLPHPNLLIDMDKASARVADAVQAREKIAVFGDYDVDGTVGAAIQRRFFRSLGLEVTVYQPDRKTEGYGLNCEALRKLVEAGHSLIISVDCGISNVKEAALVKELGADLIIVDHHEVPDPMPDAYAVLDHKRIDDVSGINNLCGAGMGFYLAMSVRSVLRERGFFSPERPEPDLRDLLDLVAVATIADMVPLVGENRILARLGLEKLRRQPTPGLAALCAVAGTDPREVRAYHVGFVIGPRINASGRLGSANLALELLSTDSLEEARQMAQTIDTVNTERMQVQRAAAEEAFQQAEELLAKEGEDFPALVLGAEGWHEGVIGIVAAKVVERYHRPVVVCGFSKDSSHGKGSVRGFQDLDALAALRECAELLMKFGGHKAAAGLAIEKENFPAFQRAFAAAIQKQVAERLGEGAKLLPKKLKIDTELQGQDLSLQSARALEALAPFGIGNPEPIFVVNNLEVVTKKVLKSAHLKLEVKGDRLRATEALWFNADDLDVNPGEGVSLAFTPQISTFRGFTRLELRIKDLKTV